MKSQKNYSTILLAIALLLSGSMLLAQDKESEQKKKQEIMEQEIQAKKEMKAAQEAELRQKKLMLEEQQQQMKEKQIQFEAQQRMMREKEREYSEQYRIMERREREPQRSSGVYSPAPYVVPLHTQDNQSQLTLRNSFQGETDTSDGEFEVEEGSRHFRFMINGKVKSGEITIKITYPSGKVFKDQTINSAAEIIFSQSLTIKEGEEDKYIGSWGYEVKTNKAEGSYMLQIMTN